MDNKIYIQGWQSWTSCKRNWFIPKRQCDYSPQNINGWLLNPSKLLKNTITGWCSWYAFGKNITEAKVLENAQKFAKYPIKTKDKYILIDDGWAHWGDWNTPMDFRFPKGIKNTANEIKKMDLKPGIWIAPFLVDKNSRLATTHTNYLVRNSFGLVNGFRTLPFNLPFFAFKPMLDLEKPKVLKYIRDCISNIVENWGFELIKLDFLYAIYFNPKYKTTQIPDQILIEILTFIRKTYPEVYTIGCGCPLGPAAGLVDAMRISADTINPYLDNIWPLNRIINSSRLKALGENIKSRKNFNKIWNIDPDVFVSRKSTGLTDEQLKKLKTIITTSKGLTFLGDDLRKIEVEPYLIC